MLSLVPAHWESRTNVEQQAAKRIPQKHTHDVVADWNHNKEEQDCCKSPDEDNAENTPNKRQMSATSSAERQQLAKATTTAEAATEQWREHQLKRQPQRSQQRGRQQLRGQQLGVQQLGSDLAIRYPQV